jgi:glycerol kinase
MQFQSDVIGCAVRRPAIRETTALGVAYLAGLATGVWRDQEELRQLWACDVIYQPRIEVSERERLLNNWHRAVERSLGWAK